MIPICGAVAIALIALLAVTFWPGEKEPEYQGKKLSEWVELASNTQEEQKAQSAVRQIGTNALPWLLKWTKHEPWHEKHHGILIAFLPTTLKERISATGWKQTGLAAKGFQALGAQATPAIPQLNTIVHGEQWASSLIALDALVEIGEPAVPALQGIMADPQWLLRQNAIIAIGNAGRLGTNELAAINLLIPALYDTNRQFAFMAATMLKCFGDQTERVVPELVQCLNSSDPELQVAAIASLGHFAKKAESAAPNLTLKLEVPDRRIRLEATNALRRIAPEVLTNGVSGVHD